MQVGESSTWGSSVYMLFKDIRLEGNPKRVRVDGEEKGSEPGAPGHSDDQSTGDKEESTETEKAWSVGWEDHSRDAL